MRGFLSVHTRGIPIFPAKSFCQKNGPTLNLLLGGITPMPWSLYIIKCSDQSLYTGITTNIPRRMHEHNAKKGAFYTRNKVPVELVYQENLPNQSAARKREAEIKRLTRKEKLELVSESQLVPLEEGTPAQFK